MVLLGEERIQVSSGYQQNLMLGIKLHYGCDSGVGSNNNDGLLSMTKNMGLPTVYTHDDFLADIKVLKSKVETASVTSVTSAAAG